MILGVEKVLAGVLFSCSWVSIIASLRTSAECDLYGSEIYCIALSCIAVEGAPVTCVCVSLFIDIHVIVTEIMPLIENRIGDSSVL